MIKPAVAIAAILLDAVGLYDTNNVRWNSAYIYLLVLVNVSVMYAFLSLLKFYSAMIAKLKPFDPLTKLVCVKFVIFVAFWQGIIISVLHRLKIIHGFAGYNAEQISTGLQDYLVCLEMVIVSVAHLYAFSYHPYIREIPYSTENNNSALLANQLLLNSKSKTYDILQSNILNTDYPSKALYVPHSSTCSNNKMEYQFLFDDENQCNTAQSRINKLLDAHFAASSAIRDFNESMPVVLPSNFQPKSGVVIRSDPEARLQIASESR